MRLALKYGLLITSGIALWVLADHLALHLSRPDSKTMFVSPLIFNLLTIVMLYLGLRAKKNGNRGRLTLGDGMRTGFLISMVYALSSCLFFIVLYLVLGPGMLAGESGAQSSPTGEVLAKAFAGLFVGALLGGLLFAASISAILIKHETGRARPFSR